MNNVHIKPLKMKSKRLRAFKRTEWKLIHPAHYGVEINEEYWNTKHLLLEAVEGKNIIGALVGELMAGVLHIKELIVKHDRRKMGIGKMLLAKAEEWAKRQGAHEMYLTTGIKWKAKDFYEKHGFIVSARLPNFYSKTDFVLLRKLLDSQKSVN